MEERSTLAFQSRRQGSERQLQLGSVETRGTPALAFAVQDTGSVETRGSLGVLKSVAVCHGSLARTEEETTGTPSSSPSQYTCSTQAIRGHCKALQISAHVGSDHTFGHCGNKGFDLAGGMPPLEHEPQNSNHECHPTTRHYYVDVPNREESNYEPNEQHVSIYSNFREELEKGQ